MRTKHRAVGGRKGFVSIYVVFSSFLLIPMAGLAIDFSVLYSVKAKLQTAVDAAAIGSGSTLNRGAAMDTVAINDVALRFFNANYPAGYFGWIDLRILRLNTGARCTRNTYNHSQR